jgi:peptidoglycan/LPS O-acetylase OafA/YrhL
MQANKGFFPGLESLRGVAALSVAIFHAVTLIGIGGQRVHETTIWNVGGLLEAEIRLLTVLFNGTAAVSLFFVLSGFVLMLSLRRGEGGLALRASDFVTARLTRIYPALLVNLIVMIIVLSAGAAAGFPPSIWRVPSWGEFVSNALLLTPGVNGASWTLKVEIEAIPYIFLAWLAWRRFGARALMACVGAGVAALFCGIQGFAFMFFLGMMAAESQSLSRWFTSWPTGIAIVVLLTSRFLFGFASPWAMLGEGGSSAWLVAAVAYGPASVLHRALASPGPRWLGRISYSFYLYHPLAIPVAVTVFGQNANPLPQAAEYAGVIVALTLPMGWASWRFVEQPIARQRRLVLRLVASAGTLLFGNHSAVEPESGVASPVGARQYAPVVASEAKQSSSP